MFRTRHQREFAGPRAATAARARLRGMARTLGRLPPVSGLPGTGRAVIGWNERNVVQTGSLGQCASGVGLVKRGTRAPCAGSGSVSIHRKRVAAPSQRARCRAGRMNYCACHFSRNQHQNTQAENASSIHPNGATDKCVISQPNGAPNNTATPRLTSPTGPSWRGRKLKTMINAMADKMNSCMCAVYEKGSHHVQ